MTDTEWAARLRRGYVVIPATIAMIFGGQIGFFASLSPGSWPRHAAGALFFGVFSIHGLEIAWLVCWLLLGFKFLADKYGSRPLGQLFAEARTIVAKDLVFWVWIALAFNALLALVSFSPRVPVVVTLCLLIVFLFVFLIIRLIGAIKSPPRQASALASIALLIGLCWGFYLPVLGWWDLECHGELVLRSGERLDCVAAKMFTRRKFMVVQGPDASTVVWPADVEPAALRWTFSPEIADFIARHAN